LSKSKGRKVSKVTQVSVTWEEALRDFLFWKQAQGLSQTTLEDYVIHVNRFFKRYPSNWQSEELKLSLMKYLSEDIKPATYNLRLAYLKSFFKWCVGEGYLENNYLKDFRKRKAAPRIVDVHEDTLKLLLELPDRSTFAGLRDYALIVLTLDTGIRPKEALSLTIQDIDLKYYAITITSDKAKTRTTRSLPILPLTAEVINRLIRSRHVDWDNEVPVFCSSEGIPLSRHTWGDRMELYSNKVGIKIRPYDLRHAFALLYLRYGGNAFGLMKTLGHQDMAMTRRYVNLSGEDLQGSHRIASPLNHLSPKKKSRVRKVR